MTNFTKRLMIAAATVVVAAGAASAQTLKADIPFTFRAGQTVLAAGTYEITQLLGQTAVTTFRIRGQNGSIMLMPQSANDPKKAWTAEGKPTLAFDCVADHCALAAIWTGPATPAYKIRHGDLGSDEPLRVALVALYAEKSE